MFQQHSGENFKGKKEPQIIAPNQTIQTNISIANDKLIGQVESTELNKQNSATAASNNYLSSTTRHQSTAAASRFTITHHGSHQADNNTLLQSTRKSRNDFELSTQQDLNQVNKKTMQETAINLMDQVDKVELRDQLDDNLDTHECINLKVASTNRLFDNTTGQSTTGASFTQTYVAAAKSAELKKESTLTAGGAGIEHAPTVLEYMEPAEADRDR